MAEQDKYSSYFSTTAPNPANPKNRSVQLGVPDLSGRAALGAEQERYGGHFTLVGDPLSSHPPSLPFPSQLIPHSSKIKVQKANRVPSARLSPPEQYPKRHSDSRDPAEYNSAKPRLPNRSGHRRVWSQSSKQSRRSEGSRLSRRTSRKRMVVCPGHQNHPQQPHPLGRLIHPLVPRETPPQRRHGMGKSLPLPVSRSQDIQK